MIWQILYVLFGWCYFIFEGITEAIATKDNSNLNTQTQQDNYHCYRILEMIGIFGAGLMVMLAAQLYLWITTLVLICVSGLGLYEMSFSWWSYGNPLYNKTSKWLGIKHPKGIFFLRLFIVGTVVLIIWLIIAGAIL